MNTSQNSTSQPHVLRWPLIYPQPQILDFNCHQVNILQSGMPQLIFKNLGVYLKDVAKKSTSVLKTLEPSPAETEQAASTLEEQARSPCGECPESEAVPVPELCQSVRSTGNTARLCKPGLSKFLAMPNWERKEHIRSLMIFKMLLTVLCQLLFSVSLTAIFRFGLEEWMHMFDGNASPLRWSPLLMYGTAAIAMGYFPLEILRKHWVDAALFILV
ncbi:uncharacterized protein LOC131928727, partial [Physella acuta]|uniref:uncharacterized protein LOC131928727 n=1 Tax=Physella acuta TaxID=109671 RepID=UPI0027DDF8E0